jgi:hypothetical protein
MLPIEERFDVAPDALCARQSSMSENNGNLPAQNKRESEFVRYI